MNQSIEWDVTLLVLNSILTSMQMILTFVGFKISVSKVIELSFIIFNLTFIVFQGIDIVEHPSPPNVNQTDMMSPIKTL